MDGAEVLANTGQACAGQLDIAAPRPDRDEWKKLLIDRGVIERHRKAASSVAQPGRGEVVPGLVGGRLPDDATVEEGLKHEEPARSEADAEGPPGGTVRREAVH